MNAKRWGLVGSGLSVLGIGALGGFLAGRVVAVPGTTALWDIAAQPIATVFAGLGAVTAGCLALYNGQKGRELDAQHHTEKAQVEREGALRQRYSEAAKFLADDSAAIREAGIYSVAALIDDWLRFGSESNQVKLARSEQQVCINLLCSYLRANRRIDPYAYSDELVADEMAVRAAIVTVLRERIDRWRNDGDVSINLAGANLEEMQFGAIQLPKSSNFSKARLRGAQFEKAGLAYALFDDADLTSTNLCGAHLEHASFHDSFGTAPQFNGAHLMHAKFYKAILPESSFIRSDLTDAEMRHAQLPDAAVDSAMLIRTDLFSADLTRVMLDRAASFEDVTLTGAILIDAKLPPGVEVP